MAVKNAKTCLIERKLGIQGFLGSLITNRRSTLGNSKLQMQYGEPKCKKLLDWNKICFSGIFGIEQFLVLPTAVRIF